MSLLRVIKDLHIATHCNTLQHTATNRWVYWGCLKICTLQHTATHCTTLHHTATNRWVCCGWLKICTSPYCRATWLVTRIPSRPVFAVFWLVSLSPPTIPFLWLSFSQSRSVFFSLFLWLSLSLSLSLNRCVRRVLSGLSLPLYNCMVVGIIGVDY